MEQFYNNSGYVGYIYGYKIPKDSIFTYNDIELITDHINNNINNMECIYILNKMFSAIKVDTGDKYEDTLLQYDTFKIMNAKNNSDDELFIYLNNEKYDALTFMSKFFKQDINQSSIVLVDGLIEHTFNIGDIQ